MTAQSVHGACKDAPPVRKLVVSIFQAPIS
jgi:hypothetical protein